jgi:transposase
MAIILRSIPGISADASAKLLVEIPEIGAITREQAGVLTGLAPAADDSETFPENGPSQVVVVPLGT